MVEDMNGPAMSAWMSMPGWLSSYLASLWGCLVQLAATQCGQAPTLARLRLGGASAVKSGSRLRRRAPTCRRRCIYFAAASGLSLDMCEVVLLECVGWNDMA